jgi:hypothetical protein
MITLALEYTATYARYGHVTCRYRCARQKQPSRNQQVGDRGSSGGDGGGDGAADAAAAASYACTSHRSCSSERRKRCSKEKKVNPQSI